jgi:Uma2 family endonuclease
MVTEIQASPSTEGVDNPTTPAPSIEGDGDQCVVLRDIGWKGYTTLLRVRGERSIPRMVYLDGSLLLLSPSYFHERLKELLGCFIMTLVAELEIPCVMAGSTTFRRRAKRGGVEGDQTYYLANLDRIRGKKKISLKVDPPPDLAIEVVVSHDADDAVEVYRRFRVPEVWICDENQLTILVLQPDGQYVPSERSHAFGFLTASETHSWVSRSQDSSDTAWIIDLRRWIAEVLAPRYQEQKKRAASATD